jgi:hypothetical protein
MHAQILEFPSTQTLRVTPAMQAGLSDHVWTLEEIASLVP